jgi:hypothetical protein
MNSITCNHCGREYEDTAVKCPSCWRPRPTKSLAGSTVAVISMLGLLMFGFYRACVYESPPEQKMAESSASQSANVDSAAPSANVDSANTLAKLRARRAALLAERLDHAAR